MRGLAGRVALVTGATGLLGGAVVSRLLEEGATVGVASRSFEKAQRRCDESGRCTAGEGVDPSRCLVPLELDLARQESVQRAVARLADAVHAPRILIANASNRDPGVLAPDQLSHRSFERLLAVDVAGHYLCARELVERLPPGETASLVFMSSIYAVAGVDPAIYPPAMKPTPLHYSAVKAAVLGLVRHLAALWGPMGIRVNAVVAGGISAPERQDEDFVRNYNRKTMLGRMAAPEEIAAAVAFLASDDASYVTGECCVVDGGFSAW